MEHLQLLKALIVATLLLGCTAQQEQPRVNSSATASGSAAALPSRTAIAPRKGACSTQGAEARAVIERYFALTISGDAAAVRDCFTSAMLHPLNSDGSESWAHAGPARELTIERLDVSGTRERFRVTATLANGDAIDWFAHTTRFFTVIDDAGSPRISEIATALAAP